MPTPRHNRIRVLAIIGALLLVSIAAWLLRTGGEKTGPTAPSAGAGVQGGAAESSSGNRAPVIKPPRPGYAEPAPNRAADRDHAGSESEGASASKSAGDSQPRYKVRIPTPTDPL